MRTVLVSVVTVAYGAEPWLERSVVACLSSEGVDVEVVLVDNGCTDGAVDRLSGKPGVTVVRPEGNLGFAGGCNLGVAASNGEMVALVNPDALVDPGALAVLTEAAGRPGVGIATACIRLADRPQLLNSAGNEIHWSGVSWSGSFAEPVLDHSTERDAFGASGAACALSRALWDRLDGFQECLFTYYEDAELSVRCWQQGLAVRYVPKAEVTHRYEFSRRTDKFYFLERNRAYMVLTCWSGRTLLLAAPALVLVEAGLFAMSIVQGWTRHKLRAYWWLLRNRSAIAERRRVVQAERTVPDRDLCHLFARELRPGNLPPPAGFGVIDAVLRAYWWLARRSL
jgi:GT2 family glycosyltransferase